MPMRPGGEVLAALRFVPETAIAAWGFIVRGDPLTDVLGGACTLACAPFPNSSIYRITVARGGPDWYIPYADQQARYCNIPRGQAIGTLVVTFPMNGCALEVRQIDGVNRFYHDADGNSMPGQPPGQQKFRITVADYAGPERTAHNRALRYFAQDVQNARLDADLPPNRGGYEISVICVKDVGEVWAVYVSTNMRLNGDAYQIKDRVPYYLGSFAD